MSILFQFRQFDQDWKIALALVGTRLLTILTGWAIVEFEGGPREEARTFATSIALATTRLGWWHDSLSFDGNETDLLGGRDDGAMSDSFLVFALIKSVDVLPVMNIFKERNVRHVGIIASITEEGDAQFNAADRVVCILVENPGNIFGKKTYPHDRLMDTANFFLNSGSEFLFLVAGFLLAEGILADVTKDSVNDEVELGTFEFSLQVAIDSHLLASFHGNVARVNETLTIRGVAVFMVDHVIGFDQDLRLEVRAGFVHLHRGWSF
jgi:hypothetical protein